MDEDWKKLTIMRYRCIPARYTIYIGGAGKKHGYSPTDIIREIQEETPIGELAVRALKDWLQSYKTGWLEKCAP